MPLTSSSTYWPIRSSEGSWFVRIGMAVDRAAVVHLYLDSCPLRVLHKALLLLFFVYKCCIGSPACILSHDFVLFCLLFFNKVHVQYLWPYSFLLKKIIVLFEYSFHLSHHVISCHIFTYVFSWVIRICITPLGPKLI